MYEELIEWLRTHAKSYEQMFGEGESSTMMRQAADAIEKLSKRIPPVPHGRLIEAEPIMKYIADGINSGEFGYDQIKVLSEIQYAPTIIPAEEEIA